MWPRPLSFADRTPPINRRLLLSLRRIQRRCCLAGDVAVREVLVDRFAISPRRVAVAATARRHQAKHVASSDRHARDFGGQTRGRAVGALQLREARGSRRTARETIGSCLEAVEVARKGARWGIDAEGADQAATAAVRAGTA